jgi:DNA-binding NarL/FixJ family response regulator
MFRDALAGVIEQVDPRSVIWQAGSAEEGLRLIRREGEPDLVVMDLHLPGMRGDAAIRALRAAYRTLPVLAVSGTEDAGEALDALRAGASAMVPKSVPAAEMVAALRAVLNGDSYVPAGLVSQHAQAHDPQLHPAPTGTVAAADSENGNGNGTLTLRQIEVLTLMAQGLSNKVIAARMCLTEKTIKAHLTRVFKVLHVVSRTQAVLAAQQLGLVAKAHTP